MIKAIFLVTLILAVAWESFVVVECQNDRCMKKTFGDPNQFNIVCVCDNTYCDELEFAWPRKSEILVVESDRYGKRFNIKTIDFNAPSNATSNERRTIKGKDKIIVELDTKKRKQKVLGFGGSFSDVAAMNLNRMGPKMHQTILEQYYGARGLAYNMARVTISGSDFSERPYTYDDLERGQNGSDFSLRRFKLQREDIRFKIPSILRAQKLVQQQQQQHQQQVANVSSNKSKELLLFASSWSAPAWMKDNRSLVGGRLREDSYGAFARYLVRFLEEYKAHGINFWGMTSQNEPIAPTERFNYNFNSMIFNPLQLNKFVRDYLGPELAKSGYTKKNNFNLIIYDDNTSVIKQYVQHTMAKDPQTMNYVSGVGIHWYARQLVPYEVLKSIQKSLPPSTFILSTEACHEHGPKPGDWSRGADYASDIIQTFRYGNVGWIDWNLVLDMQGGPNWASNFADAPILYDDNQNKYYKNPMYYALGHFTRFLEAGAQVLDCQIVSDDIVWGVKVAASDKSITGKENLIAMAVERPNKLHYSVVVLNNSLNKKLVNVQLNGRPVLRNHIIVGPQSITTIVVPANSM